MHRSASSIATPGSAIVKGSASSASGGTGASASASANAKASASTSASAGTSASASQPKPAEKKPKKVPEWAQGAQLAESLRGEQMYRDPDEIFGPIEMTCNLQGTWLFSQPFRNCLRESRIALHPLLWI